MLLAVLPVNVSLKAEPVRFSILASVSPCASPPVPVPEVRFTFTAAVEAV